MAADKNTTQEFTLTVYAENMPGILVRIVGIIARRHYNIESLTTSPSSIEEIHKTTIVVKVTETQIRKLCAQIDKQVDILKAFYYKNNEIVYQEIALYKIPTQAFFGGDTLERILRQYNARIITVESEYIVVEKMGHEDGIIGLLNVFKELGIYEFVRSGRVAVVKPMERLNNYLKQTETEAKLVK